MTTIPHYRPVPQMILFAMLAVPVFVACVGDTGSKNTYSGPGPSYVDTQDSAADTDTDADSDPDSDADTDTDTDTDTDADTDTDTGTHTDPPTPDFVTVWGNGMMLVPAGTFTMGGGRGDPDDGYTDHEVTLTRDSWVGQGELTQEQWALFPDAYDPTPSSGADCPGCPVDQVSWQDAALYANALSDAEGFAQCYLADGSDVDPAYVADPYSCPGYRLLTEAEWEYAARGGLDTEFSGSNSVDDVAWYVDNSGDVYHEGCQLRANPFGLFDLSGNINEWVNDRADPEYGGYGDGSASTDPPGPTDPYNRWMRGGAWPAEADGVTVTHRFGLYYTGRIFSIGFRLARTVSP